MKIYYVANARMPNEKAHGIQIAKMCEAFIEEGAELVLVVPRRGMHESLRAFYHLRVDVPTVRLPAFNLYNYERPGYFISSLSFMLTSLMFLWWKKLKGERFAIYTRDMDTFSSTLLPLVGAPLFSEMHGGKPSSLFQRFLFRYLDGVVALNALIIERLKKTFPFAKAQYLVGPSGVDPALFRAHDRSEARRHIDVEEGMPIVMYTGRFIAWKGLEIIPEAAGLVSDARWYMVGGTREQFEKLTKAKALANMVFVEHVPQQEISWWLAAADVLLVLGTKRDPLSFSYTSPMKLFEYLLSERPIIASDTPAIRQVVSEQEVTFYEPDNANSLAEQVRAALLQTGGVREKIGHARVKGGQFSWKGRAQRILQLISTHHDSKGSTVASNT